MATDTARKQCSREDFVALYSKHHVDLLRYTLALLPDRHLAEDVVQETALLLWKKFDQYDPTQPFLVWARRFAYFEVLKVLKRQSIRGKYFSEAVVERLAEERAVNEEQLSVQREALADCVAKLDDASRELLMLRYNREMPMQEAARQQGKSANALYLTLHRVRQTLVQCVNRRLKLEGWT